MWYGHNLPYETVKDHYFEQLKYHLGVVTFNAIKQKIENSDRVSRLLQKTVNWGEAPSQIAIFNTVQVIPYFVFRLTNFQVLALGCLFILERWNKEVNSKFHFAADADLVDIAERIIAYCENQSKSTLKTDLWTTTDAWTKSSPPDEHGKKNNVTLTDSSPNLSKHASKSSQVKELFLKQSHTTHSNNSKPNDQDNRVIRITNRIAAVVVICLVIMAGLVEYWPKNRTYAPETVNYQVPAQTTEPDINAYQFESTVNNEDNSYSGNNTFDIEGSSPTETTTSDMVAPPPSEVGSEFSTMMDQSIDRAIQSTVRTPRSSAGRTGYYSEEEFQRKFNPER